MEGGSQRLYYSLPKFSCYSCLCRARVALHAFVNSFCQGRDDVMAGLRGPLGFLYLLINSSRD